MAVANEFKRLMNKAGAVPYRRGGKIRVAVDPRLPKPTLDATIAAVKAFAPSLADDWTEPDSGTANRWKADGLVPRDVCDDPCPRDTDPETCPAAWLLARCERYHFRLVRGPGDKLRAVPADGWSMDAVRPLLPAWFSTVCRTRVADLTAVAPQDDAG